MASPGGDTCHHLFGLFSKSGVCMCIVSILHPPAISHQICQSPDPTIQNGGPHSVSMGAATQDPAAFLGLGSDCYLHPPV